MSNTDLRFCLGIGCHDLGSTGYLGVSFVDFARFSLGRFALRGARSSDSFTLGRSFAARFDFSRATLTRRGLTSLPFVGLHGFSGFDSHYSFADCRGRVGPGICGGFGPSPLRLGVVCRLRFGRLSWFGFGVVGEGSVVRCIRFAPSVPSQIFSLGCDPRALRVFAISRMLVVAAFGFFAALIARRFFVVHVCDRGVFTSAQL
ncbi:hypothetical protein [Amycolatopsis sp. NPDC050768]|uniref:hypothetical protein n=1 Tax=Amycolatopsis sp. NPDC050768 TaxID=3154839 RepID=UPI0033CAE5CB